MAFNIRDNGYSVHTNALPEALGDSLWVQSHGDSQSDLEPAGIGRSVGLQIETSIRTDKISWIDDTTDAGGEWIKWTSALQSSLNAILYLGLFSFESHYALYHPGGFYKTHVDAFRGEKNRILSLVVFLNDHWRQADAGELVLFSDAGAGIPVVVRPEFGTVVVFLSEDIPHEVLVTNRDRYSIAGWFSANRDNALNPANAFNPGR